MPFAQAGYASPAQLDAQIQRFRQSLGPEVVHMNYNIGVNHEDEPMLYCRVVMEDDVFKRRNLGEITSEIIQTFFEKLHPLENFGMYPLFRFRSRTGFETLNDPEWA